MYWMRTKYRYTLFNVGFKRRRQDINRAGGEIARKRAGYAGESGLCGKRKSSEPNRSGANGPRGIERVSPLRARAGRSRRRKRPSKGERTESESTGNAHEVQSRPRGSRESSRIKR